MKLFGTRSLFNNRPHPGPLPRERGNDFTVTGNVGGTWFATFPKTKSNQAETARGAIRFQADADSYSLSPGERVRVRASVSTN
jgi:hypothetical protein